MNIASATLADVAFAKGGGLVPVVVQARDGQVLMLGYGNREALELTLSTGRLHLWSRSRGEIWLKGAPSGNFLLVDGLCLDCDGDAVVATVSQATGATPVCHTGAATCFHRDLAP